MLNKTLTGSIESNQIEELRSAIFTYKSTIQQIENSKIKNFNKPFIENMRKNLHSREDQKLQSIQNLIKPSMSTLYLPNIYDFLLKVSKVHQVSLNVIPSLFLPKPASLLYTNSQGIVQSCEKPKAFQKFFCSLSKSKHAEHTPLLIFKQRDHKFKLFSDIGQSKVYLNRHKETPGILQEFTFPPSDRTSLCRVHLKEKKFRYFLLINKHPYKQSSHLNQRSSSCADSLKKFKSDESIFFENIVQKKRESLADQKTKEKLFQTPGILNRIQAKVNRPWKEKNFIKFALDGSEHEKFLINGVNLNDCAVTDMTTTYPEIEKMMNQLVLLIQNVLLNEKFEISEIVCEFLKDSQKNWKVLSVPMVKVKTITWVELFHLNSLSFLNIKPETESEPLDDMSVFLDEKAEKSTVENLSHSESIKTQLSLKAENNSFQDKFKKIINKIDRIRKREKVNANVGLRYEMIQNYKTNLHIDRNGSMTRKFLTSPELPTEQLHSFGSQRKDEGMGRLHSNSKYYDKFNSTLTVAKYTNKSVESYENIIHEIRKHKYPTRKLDEKYGGKKFILNFIEGITKKITGTPLARVLKVEENSDIVFCPGLPIVFDCKVDLSLARLLHEKHKKLCITKEEFEGFSEVFSSTLKDFEFQKEDLEYLLNLVGKLSRDIYIFKPSKYLN
jgi:hypothetical protein